MNPILLEKAIPAVFARGITTEEFQAESGIVSRMAAKAVLEYMINKGIGIATSGSLYLFSKADKMKLAVLALQKGCDIENISKSLSWKDFESLASEILGLCGYQCRTNVRLSEPHRIEIDVIGINHKLAIVADCKHWKQYSPSSISSYAQKQTERTKMLLKMKGRTKHYSITQAVPIILTLYSMNVEFIDGVPIVPIHKFKSFIEDIPFHLSEVRVISK
ncbi:MAG: hypothetical protein M3297_02805 [Thermoproteota archaeon]|nr:hypothetical protein [Thermoproteota archaeon]